MAEHEKCRRCGERAQTNDNIIGSTFWGFITPETETAVTRRVRVASHYYVRNERTPEGRSLVCDERLALCSDCWGLLIGRFMHGRDVPPLAAIRKPEPDDSEVK